MYHLDLYYPETMTFGETKHRSTYVSPECPSTLYKDLKAHGFDQLHTAIEEEIEITFDGYDESDFLTRITHFIQDNDHNKVYQLYEYGLLERSEYTAFTVTCDDHHCDQVGTHKTLLSALEAARSLVNQHLLPVDSLYSHFPDKRFHMNWEEEFTTVMSEDTPLPDGLEEWLKENNFEVLVATLTETPTDLYDENEVLSGESDKNGITYFTMCDDGIETPFDMDAHKININCESYLIRNAAEDITCRVILHDVYPSKGEKYAFIIPDMPRFPRATTQLDFGLFRFASDAFEACTRQFRK
jgi:hypothetical protein